jgi:hypothetical protein
MRGLARLIAGVVLVLAVAWGGLWWYAQGRLHDMLATNAGLRNTDDGNSVVSYDSISKGTNPLAASATLHNLRWSLRAPGEDTASVISMAQVTVWIDALNPLVMHLGLPNQIGVSTPKGVGSATFGSIAIDMRLNPHALFNRQIYAVTGQTMALHDITALVAGSFPILHIDDITGHETIDASAGPNQTAFTAQDSIDGISLPPAMVLLAHVPFGGKITHVGFNISLSGPADWTGLTQQLRAPQLSEQDKRKLAVQAAHDWAAKGGSGKADLTLALGPTTVNANGAVAFDADAQPNGSADITADHLDTFTAALTNAYPQLQQSIVNIEAQLSPYLATTDAGGQVLNVQVAYGKPGVVVNGTRKADMPPLDWAALENPPAPIAPVAQAPGDGSGAASAGP